MRICFGWKRFCHFSVRSVESPLVFMKTQLEGRSLISVPAAESAFPFRAVNPATDQTLEPDYYPLDVSGVDAVASQAWEAFADYGRQSGAEKAAFLRKIADNVDAVVEDLAERTTAETALPEARVRAETARTTGQLRLFADLSEEGSWAEARIETALPDRKPLPKPDLRSLLQPLGPVAVFCAGNFPLAFSVAGGDTAAALAAGCPVIVKAHRSHPGTAEIVGQAVMAAVDSCQMPSGVFSLIYGGGREVGAALVKHPAVKAVGFTGSRAGGIDLMTQAALDRDELIPVYAEMSSINPVVILPEALAQNGEAIAAGLCNSVTLGLGQFCTNPGIVLLPAGEEANRFALRLKENLANAPAGYALNSGIAESYRKGVRQIAALQGRGVIAHLDNAGDNAGQKCRIGPALFQASATAFLQEKTLHKEAFGPSTLLITCQDQNELLQGIDSLEGQLTGTIHGTPQDLQNAPLLVEALRERVGRLVFGGFPTGVEVCHAMVHGGPWPATSDNRCTSVGTLSIQRFVRPVCYQNAPPTILPDALKNANPLGIWRLVNGERTRNPL